MDLGFVLLLLLPAGFLYTFLYMVGQVLAKEAMKKNAQEELWEWVVNLFLLLFFYHLLFYQLPSGELVSSAILGGAFSVLDHWGWEGSWDSSLSPSENVERLFAERMEQAFALAVEVEEEYSFVAREASKGFSFELTTSALPAGKAKTSSSTRYAPCRAYSLIGKLLAQVHNHLLSFYSQLLNLTHFLAQMERSGAIALFLAVGFFFRSFHITRPIGGFLVAFAISTVLFLPAAYILMDGILTQYLGSDVVSAVGGMVGGMHLPGPCGSGTMPSSVDSAVKDFYEDFYSEGAHAFLVSSYASLLTYAFAWLLYFSALLGLLSILGANVSPFVLNMLLRV